MRLLLPPALRRPGGAPGVQAVAAGVQFASVISSEPFDGRPTPKGHHAIPRRRSPALAPAAFADAPDVVTHENVDRTRTINVCARSRSSPLRGLFTIWQYLDDSGAVVRERPRRACVHGHVVEPREREADLFRARRAGLRRLLPGRRSRRSSRAASGSSLAKAVAQQVGRIVFVVAADAPETIPFVAGQRTWTSPGACAYLT